MLRGPVKKPLVSCRVLFCARILQTDGSELEFVLDFVM
jgi:hypothetical protein